MSDVETGRITITHRLTDGGDGEEITFDFEGTAERAMTALGMLAMTSDTVLHPPEDD